MCIFMMYTKLVLMLLMRKKSVFKVLRKNLKNVPKNRKKFIYILLSLCFIRLFQKLEKLEVNIYVCIYIYEYMCVYFL